MRENILRELPDIKGIISDLPFGEVILGFVLWFVVTILFIVIVLGIITIIGKAKVLQKAGKPWWGAIIPFYSSWLLVEISGLKWWFWLFICGDLVLSITGAYYFIQFTGLLSLFGWFCCNYNLARKFKLNAVGYAFGLTLLPFIFYPVLGFGVMPKYEAKTKVSPYGPFPENN